MTVRTSSLRKDILSIRLKRVSLCRYLEIHILTALFHVFKVKNASSVKECAIVNIDWLLSSIENKRAMQSEPFRLEDLTGSSDGSSLKRKRKLDGTPGDYDGSLAKKPKSAGADFQGPGLCDEHECQSDGKLCKKLALLDISDSNSLCFN